MGIEHMKDFRLKNKLLGLLLLLGGLLSFPHASLANETGFVQVEDTKFVLDGETFYFTGANVHRLALLPGTQEHPTFSEDEIWTYFEEVRLRKIRVLRIWGFANVEASGIQTKIGKSLNESALKRLDLVIHAARTKGIKLLITLVNYEDDYGGIETYVDQLIGPNQDKHLFYTDHRTKKAYRRYVRRILNRKNTYNGTRYKKEPAIFAWELCNEPHTADNYEKDRDLPPGQIVHRWLSEMAAYVKRLDPNHLITTGEEGYRTRGNISRGPLNRRLSSLWVDNGMKGSDFDQNAAIPEIDFLTIHLFPDNWGIDDFDWGLNYFLPSRRNIAHHLNKPIVLSEFGLRQQNEYSAVSNGLKRAGFIRAYFDRAISLGYAGVMAWQLIPRKQSYDMGQPYSYDFDFGSESEAVLTEVAHRLYKDNRSNPLDSSISQE